MLPKDNRNLWSLVPSQGDCVDMPVSGQRSDISPSKFVNLALAF